MSSMRVLSVCQCGCGPTSVRSAILAKTGAELRVEGVKPARVLEGLKTFLPQVVLIDAAIPGVLDILAELRSFVPHMHCILLTKGQDSELELEALRRGAHGSLAYDCSAEQLMWALDAVCRGELWASRKMLSSLLERLLCHGAESAGQAPESSSCASLTSREQEILLWLGQGLTNKEIGRRLAISDLTVKSHLQHIYAKLGVHRRSQVVLKSSADLR